MIEVLERPAHRPDPTRQWSNGADAGITSAVATRAPDVFAAMIDEVDYPMLLVTSDMQLLHVNKAARRCLEDLQIFKLTDGELQLRRGADQTAVSRAVNAACTRAMRGYVQLSQGQGRGDAVAVVPQRGRDGVDAALLILSKAVVCEELPMSAYARNHGLTASEARVLAALSSGQSAPAIASSHGVAVSTVRTQLNSLRAKTGARNIGDLLLKLAVLPPLVNVLQSGRG